MAPLTLDNVLSDSVSFVEWIRSNVSGAENSPVFIESGMTDRLFSIPFLS